MNRTILIIVAVIVVAVFAVGGLLFLSSRPPASTPPLQQFEDNTPSYTNSTVSTDSSYSKEAVQAAYRSELDKYPSDNTELYEISIVGDYALQVWVGDHMGGQALLKYDTTQRRWILVSGGGGSWSVDTLVTLMNVPQDVAVQLLRGLPQ